MSAAPGLPPDLFTAQDWRTLLDVSLTGIHLVHPVYESPGGAMVDFALDYLNPAAQRMTGLAEQPGGTLLGHFPHARAAGIFQYYQRVFETGELLTYETNYQADGLDNYFKLSARRSGERLLVSFTDTSDQDRSRVEAALRASQAAEQQTHAAAERERGELARLLEQAPVAIAVFRGPTYTIELANALIARLWDRPPAQLLGRDVYEAMPEAAGQGFEELLDEVMATGVPYTAHGRPSRHARAGRLDTLYWDFTYVPLPADDRPAGVLVVATDVTEQVLARQQVEQLVRELEAARAATERERALLQALLTQAPVAIALFEGDDVRVAAATAAMAAIWGYTPAQVVGRPLLESVPELRGQGFDDLLRQVLHTHVPVTGTETPAVMQRDGVLTTSYYNFVYQPLYAADGQVLGVIDVAVDVTEQVLARQQVEQFNQALEARVRERTRVAEQALAEAERQRRSLVELVEQAPAALCIVAGPAFTYEAFNPLYAAMFGGRPQLGRPMGEVLPEVVNHPGFLAFRAVYQEGRTIRQSEVLVPLARPGDGVLEDHYFSYTQQPRYDQQGQIDGVFVFAVEVTDQVLARQQVEQLNRDLEARVQERTHQVEVTRAEAERQRGELERVFEQAPVAIAVYRGPTYTIELVNATATRLWGRTREQVLGKGLFEALPEIVGMGYEEPIAGVLATGVPYVAHAMEAQHDRHGQRETLYWDFVFVPAHAADGRINGVMVVANEVTAQVLARRQIEQVNQELEARVAERTHQLAQQQQQLQAMFEQAPVALFVLRGTEYVFEVVNPSMGHLLAMAPDQVLGRRYFDLLPMLEEQGYRQLLDGVWHSGQEYVAQEQAARLPHHGEGETGYYNFVYVPLREADGRVSGILCVAVDVSTQVLARQQVQRLNRELAATNGALTATNQALQQSNAQLTRTNVDLDTFVYTASHDLKAPITNIESIVLALRSALPPTGQPEELVPHLLDLLDQTTARFQTTIGQLTDLSKLQLAHTGPAEPVDLAAAVEAVRLDLAPVIVAADARLAVEVASDLRVSFSPANLRSIVYNLLSNALKYRSPERPAQVLLRADRTGQRVTLEVQDNGLGLNEHQLERLFGLFQRLHTHVEGTGVGLYITKRLVENGGGTIAVESKPDVGTTFTVTFPA